MKGARKKEKLFQSIVIPLHSSTIPAVTAHVQSNDSVMVIGHHYFYFSMQVIPHPYHNTDRYYRS